MPVYKYLCMFCTVKPLCRLSCLFVLYLVMSIFSVVLCCCKVCKLTKAIKKYFISGDTNKLGQEAHISMIRIDSFYLQGQRRIFVYQHCTLCCCPFRYYYYFYYYVYKTKILWWSIRQKNVHRKSNFLIHDISS